MKQELRRKKIAKTVDLDKFDEIDRELYIKLGSEEFQ